MIKIITLFLCTFLLVACSTKKTKTVFQSPDQVIQWDNSGRVGIRTDKDAISGNFNWQHNKNEFAFLISGPFGQGSTRISGAAAHTSSKNIKRSKDHHFEYFTLEYKDVVATGNDAEALLREHFGWNFPITQISYWVRGIKYPHSEAEETYSESTLENKRPQLLEIIQDGWTITYRNYTTVQGIQLPQKLRAEKPPFRVNLIINSWEVE